MTNGDGRVRIDPRNVVFWVVVILIGVQIADFIGLDRNSIGGLGAGLIFGALLKLALRTAYDAVRGVFAGREGPDEP